ncbi:MAG: hypothetical protein QOD53_109 [Thermoleophilaceae bacterium]|nr:hypothetical protein [Thermoleophilaceae bacterium]
MSLPCLAAALSACGGGGTKTSNAPDGQAPAPAQQQAAAPGCRQVAAPRPKSSGGQTKPKGKLDGSKHWSLNVETNCGTFTIALDVKSAPNAGASLVSLAKAGFFDGTIFTRIVPGFVVQGGDPTGGADGDPGYTTVDPPDSGVRYTRGVVAMAKGDSEPSGAGGSQFFVVTGQDAQLPPDYAFIGRVSKAMGVVDRIGGLGDPSTEKPTAVVEIQHMSVGS